MRNSILYRHIISPHGIAGLIVSIALGGLCFSLPSWASHDTFYDVVEESCGEENTNGKKILIAYDSKHGSTAVVASQIAEALCNCGLQVDISLARKVEGVAAYDAVVAGSPLYWAKFLPGVQKFLKEHENTLATMSVALFVLSTYVDEETGLVKEEVIEFFVDGELEKVPSINLIGKIGLFGGAFTLRELFPVEAFSMKLQNYTDMDYLNAGIVNAWSQNLCSLLE